MGLQINDAKKGSRVDKETNAKAINFFGYDNSDMDVCWWVYPKIGQ